MTKVRSPVKKLFAVMCAGLLVMLLGGCKSVPEPNAAELYDMTALAQEFLQRRTSALVGTESSIPISALSVGSAKESISLVNAERGILAELNARRNRLRSVGVEYSHCSAKLIPKAAEVEKGTVVLSFEEQIRLYYAHPSGGQPLYTAWNAPLRFVYKRAGDGWELISQEYTGSDPFPENEPTP